MSMTVTEIRDHASALYQDLERLRSEVEGSENGPDVKSSMALEIIESQARVRRMLQVCDTAVVFVPAV